MTKNPLIAGIGEALYDLLPVGPVLGGAPLNAALQAHQIGSYLGGHAVMVSRIGQDELGRALTKKLKEHGMDHSWVSFWEDEDLESQIVKIYPPQIQTNQCEHHAT